MPLRCLTDARSYGGHTAVRRSIGAGSFARFKSLFKPSLVEGLGCDNETGVCVTTSLTTMDRRSVIRSGDISLDLRRNWFSHDSDCAKSMLPNRSCAKNSSSVDTYGTPKPGDARKNKSCLFLFRAQPVFGFHGHTAL